jgi:hypothetical protein
VNSSRADKEDASLIDPIEPMPTGALAASQFEFFDCGVDS